MNFFQNSCKTLGRSFLTPGGT